jgi:CRISPR-associated exonuclease Cas4
LRVSATEYIAISALQHYQYCPRQCALIHVEQQWAENRHTAEGGLLHRRVDSEATRTRRGVRVVTAMPLRSDALGLVGVADVVEISEPEGERRVFPVEYKRGRPKRHRADEVQLCAQALCLEEMLQVRIEAGALYYGKTRRRRDVMFDEELRALTRDVAASCRTMILSGSTPPPRYAPKLCDPCSLKEICRPQRLSRSASVRSWLHRQLKD